MNEKQLTSLARDGDTNAYRALVDRYQAGLIIYCENIVKDRQVGEDLAQDAFIKAFYSLKSFDAEKGTFSTWLYTIANRCALDHLKKQRTFVAKDGQSLVIPHYEAIDKADRHDIQMAIQRLRPPEYAHVIKAYFWEGKSYDTIATELSVPVGTIGTWMSRAKLQLRKELS